MYVPMLRSLPILEPKMSPLGSDAERGVREGIVNFHVQQKRDTYRSSCVCEC